MQRHAVIIGVDRTGDLPVLGGAASGAAEFEVWCLTQGLTTKLLVDGANQRVGIHDVRKAVADVDPRSYAQLILFFAGHGILKSPDEEYWLLSDAPGDQYDAVNVVQSVAYARNSGFRHVVFISDACRGIPQTPRLTGIKGMSVFSNPPAPAARPKIDQLYATAPADPAYEATVKDAMAAAGIFTTELLKGLKGKVPSVPEQHGNSWFVTAHGLDPYLVSQVPQSVGKLNPSYRQVPEVRPESSLPLYLAELDGWTGAPGVPAPPLTTVPPPGPRTIADSLNAIAEGAGPSGPLHTAVQTIALASGRQGFESGSGFTVLGAKVVRALARPGTCDVFEESGVSQVRVKPADPSQQRLQQEASVLLEFANGHGTVLAVWPGYVGVVSIEGERVVNVSYNPARHTPEYDEFKQREQEIAQRRALVSVAARNGRFRLRPEEAYSYAMDLRSLKWFDPTLGLYAAYAYAQVGALNEIRSVADYMRGDLGSVPFDVLVLANLLSSDIPRVPFCPMLTQGWAFLDGTSTIPQLEEPVARAWQHTLPSLWTTFNQLGIAFIRSMFEEVATGGVVTA